MRLPTTARVLATAQLAGGAALLARPEGVLALTGPAPTRVVRLLGGRLAVQGAWTALAPTPRTVEAGAGVDALHGASMLALAAADRRHRRPALVSAAVALASAAASVRIAQSHRRG